MAMTQTVPLRQHGGPGDNDDGERRALAKNCNDPLPWHKALAPYTLSPFPLNRKSLLYYELAINISFEHYDHQCEYREYRDSVYIAHESNTTGQARHLIQVP